MSQKSRVESAKQLGILLGTRKKDPKPKVSSGGGPDAFQKALDKAVKKPVKKPVKKTLTKKKTPAKRKK